MKDYNISFSVFTKPWMSLSIDKLGWFIKSIGFSGIEFPLRNGYQVEPENAEKGLPQLAGQLDGYGLKITSVAGSLSEKVFAGCAAADIPIVRIMAATNLKTGYYASIKEKGKEIDDIIYLCKKYKIKVGIQQHFGPGINNSMELKHFLEKYDPQHIGAIWDAAHSALAGEEPEQGLEIIGSHLCMVNLKNAFYKIVTGPEAEKAKWKRYFTSGKHGLSSWVRVSDYLKHINYKGIICLTAEYSAEKQVNRLIAEDLIYAKSLFA